MTQTHTHRRPNAVGLVGEYAATGGDDLCEKCGQVKSYKGPLCQTCINQVRAAEIERQATARMRATRQAKRPLYDAALEEGWTVPELMQLAQRNELPTMEEIRARRVKRLIKGFCEGMTDDV